MHCPSRQHQHGHYLGTSKRQTSQNTKRPCHCMNVIVHMQAVHLGPHWCSTYLLLAPPCIGFLLDLCVCVSHHLCLLFYNCVSPSVGGRFVVLPLWFSWLFVHPPMVLLHPCSTVAFSLDWVSPRFCPSTAPLVWGSTICCAVGVFYEVAIHTHLGNCVAAVLLWRATGSVF